MTRDVIHDEIGKIPEQEVAAIWRYKLTSSPRINEENDDKPIRITVTLSDVKTGYLPRTSHTYYHYHNLLVNQNNVYLNWLTRTSKQMFSTGHGSLLPNSCIHAVTVCGYLQISFDTINRVSTWKSLFIVILFVNLKVQEWKLNILTWVKWSTLRVILISKSFQQCR
jgi:hypothetical protein